MEEKNLDLPLGTSENPLYVKPEPPFERPRQLVEWQAPPRAFAKKSFSYLVTLFLVSVVLAAFLIVLQQYSFALVILALAFLLGVYGTVEPLDNHYEIWTTGVKVGDKLYSYLDLRTYWVKEEKGVQILHVSTFLNLPHRLMMAVPLDLQETIEEQLLKYLPYHEEAERDFLPTLDHFIEALVPRVPQRIIDLFSSRFSS